MGTSGYRGAARGRTVLDDALSRKASRDNSHLFFCGIGKLASQILAHKESEQAHVLQSVSFIPQLDQDPVVDRGFTVLRSLRAFENQGHLATDGMIQKLCLGTVSQNGLEHTTRHLHGAEEVVQSDLFILEGRHDASCAKKS